MWIEAVAEHIAHLPVPFGADLYPCQHGEPDLVVHLLDADNCLHAVMIGNSNQAEFFLHQIVKKLFCGPAPIAISRVQMQVDGCV